MILCSVGFGRLVAWLSCLPLSSSFLFAAETSAPARQRYRKAQTTQEKTFRGFEQLEGTQIRTLVQRERPSGTLYKSESFTDYACTLTFYVFFFNVIRLFIFNLIYCHALRIHNALSAAHAQLVKIGREV
jgi:hypothetical protein